MNTIISIAGSASEEIITSRLEPIPPKAVPTSSPASAIKNLALPRSAMTTIRSAADPKRRPVAKVGTRDAAIHVVANIR